MKTQKALELSEPEPHGFIYLGFHVGKPQRAPLYRATRTRRREAARLLEAADALSRRDEVVSVRVFRAFLVPPLSGAPRHDLAMLVRTAGVDDLDETRRSAEIAALGGTEVLVGSNAARIGQTESDLDKVFLFNHFTASGETDPVEAWLGLTNWYTSKIRVDNSTALRPKDDQARFALVNYARLPSSPPAFLINQLLRPSFHRVVRGTLKANRMRALPGFYRMIGSA